MARPILSSASKLQKTAAPLRGQRRPCGFSSSRPGDSQAISQDRNRKRRRRRRASRYPKPIQRELYGAFVRDLNGKKIEAVTYTARESFWWMPGVRLGG